MDRANKTVINLNLKDLSDVPPSYVGQRGKLVAVTTEENGGKYVDINNFMEESGVSADIDAIKARLQYAEDKLADLVTENDILLNRSSDSSQFISDTFSNFTVNNTNEFTSLNPAETQANNDWNDNWKYNDNRKIFKQGYMRPRKQYFMLEWMDEFNLVGTGVANFSTNISSKNDIDYDATNNCYWLMVHGDVAGNGLGCIVKLSTNMIDNKVTVISQWYLEAAGTNTGWTGICSDGAYLYISYVKSAANTFYKLKINSDGTLGKVGYTKANGEMFTIAGLVNSSEWVGTDTTANGYCCSITNYSSTEIMYFFSDTTTTNCSIKFKKKSDGSVGTSTTITGFWPYVGDTSNNNEHGLHYDGTNLWITVDGATEGKRYIQKFNLSTDIKSNVVFKSSGRWYTNRYYVQGNGWSARGITIGHHGDIMEVANTASNGTFITRRALNSALWAENQVAGEKFMILTTSNDWWSGMVIDENGNYYACYDNSAGTRKIYKFKSDGTTYNSTVSLRPNGMCYDGTNVWWIVYTGTQYNIYKGTLASLSALIEAGTTITFGTNWGTLQSGTNGNTTAWYDVTYNYDDNIIYIISDGDDKIKSLTMDGATLANVQSLPAAANYWIGIAYKNSNIYLLNRNDTALSPNYTSRIWVVPKSTLGSTTVYVKHIHQDPNVRYNGVLRCMQFDGNDLMVLDENYSTPHSRVYRMKVLEDPDVLQLHCFMNNYNILLTTNIGACSAITKRYFDPDKFFDIRDVPDQYYCAVGYSDEGFSILHLDAFLSGRSSTGKDRYDVTKIRTWHFKRATNNIITSASIAPADIFIEKDLIFVVCYNTSQTMTIVDLKAGKTFIFGDTYGGQYYDGTLTERNDAKGWAGTANSELYVTAITARRTNVRTFTKEDESDFSFDNPKTYALMGTASGTDLFVIDWDANGNRTIVKVWNNIFNAASLGAYTPWIAPSGKFFEINNAATGGLYVVSKGNASGVFVNPFIWEINADTLGYTAIHSSITGGFGRVISANSRCWKTSSGQWRHQLVVGTLDQSDGAGVERVAIIDVESILMETAYYYNSAYWYCSNLDNFEDLIFAIHGHYSTGTPSYIFIHKRLKFDNNIDAEEGGTWTRPIYTITQTSRPWFTTATSADSKLKYSKDFGILSFGAYQNTGIFQMFFMRPQMNNCEYVSKEFTIDNPSELIYKQSNIIPMAGEVT